MRKTILAVLCVAAFVAAAITLLLHIVEMYLFFPAFSHVCILVTLIAMQIHFVFWPAFPIHKSGLSRHILKTFMLHRFAL